MAPGVARRVACARATWRERLDTHFLNTFVTVAEQGSMAAAARILDITPAAVAQQVRTLIKQDFDRVFEQYDVVVAPVSPFVAWPIGAKVDDPLQMYLADIFTLSVNLAGLCGISVPCGFSEGLPVGLQVIGRPFGEADILRAAYAYEQATPWHTMKPAVESVAIDEETVS